jgi:hypothetical protein
MPRNILSTIETGFTYPTWEATMKAIAETRNEVFFNQAKPAFPSIIEQWCFVIRALGKTTGSPKGPILEVCKVKTRSKQAVRAAADRFARKNKGVSFCVEYIGTMHGMDSPFQFNQGQYTENAFNYSIQVYNHIA